MAYFDFMKRILEKREVTLFNNGELARDMTYIDDIVDGILSAITFAEKSERYHEIFNLGNSAPVKTKYLLQLIQDKLKVNAQIKHINNPNEVKITFADCSKSNELLNYDPKVNVEEGMDNFFDWFRSYYEL